MIKLLKANNRNFNKTLIKILNLKLTRVEVEWEATDEVDKIIMRD